MTKLEIAVRLSTALLAGAFILFLIVSASLASPLTSLACERVKREATEILNRAVLETALEYSEADRAGFAVQQRGEDGTSVLFIDAAAMNLMASRIIERAQKSIEALSEAELSVSLGSASGVALFGGRGPRIGIGAEPIGAVNGRYKAAFSSAGVNQTRYSASLVLTASVRVMVAGKVSTVEAEHVSPLCETIVVGGVPSAYTNVESLEDALNLIPTEADR